MVDTRLNKTRYYHEIETFETDNRINYKSGTLIVEGKTYRAWYNRGEILVSSQMLLSPNILILSLTVLSKICMFCAKEKRL